MFSASTQPDPLPGLDDVAEGVSVSLRRSLRDDGEAGEPAETLEATALRAFDILRSATQRSARTVLPPVPSAAPHRSPSPRHG